jgi:hypothetical protein
LLDNFEATMKKFLLFLFLTGSLNMLSAQVLDTALSRGLKDAEENSFLDVFPNPTDGTFQIMYFSKSTSPPAGWGGTLVINITNSNFKLVYTETVLDFDGEYNRTIDLKKEGSDTYLIELVAGKKIMTKREIVN